MPHISKHKLRKETTQKIFSYLDTFLTNTSPKKRREIFSEMITHTEKIMLAKRLAILFLLQEGKSMNSISETLKISPSTVKRFAVGFESGRFKKTTNWLASAEAQKGILFFLLSMAQVPKDVQGKSLSTIVREYL